MITNFTLLVHNRPRLTAQTLFSLDTSDHMNITILDDASDEPTSTILRAYQQAHPGRVALIRNEVSAGTGVARNQVIRLAEASWGRGDYLYLSDNDIFVLRPDWLDILVRCYEAAWPAGFRVLGAYNHPFHVPFATLDVGDGFHVRQVHALALQSMLMRWEVWDAFGPFEVTPVGAVCQGEDVTFSQKITEMGGKLGVVSPALLVNTGVTNSFGQAIPGADLVRGQAPQGVVIE